MSTEQREQFPVIRLPERFDFSFHKTFAESYQTILEQQQVNQVEIDFSRVLYLDSSALGMLVLLAKKFAPLGTRLVITGASGTALEIIEMANLNKLFEIQ